MDFNNNNNDDFKNENNINNENNYKNNIFGKNFENRNKEHGIINKNNIGNNNKINEDIYNNADINDFSNPFKDFDNNFKENENKHNINLYENNNNNINNNNVNIKPDNDFTNPFQNYDFKQEESNNINPFSEKNNDINKFNNLNNNNNNNSDEEDEINPYLIDNNNKNIKVDDDFSNPFKNEFGFNENNNISNNNNNNNNNNFGPQRNPYNNNNQNFSNKNTNYNNNNNNNFDNFKSNNFINNNYYNNYNQNNNNNINTNYNDISKKSLNSLYNTNIKINANYQDLPNITEINNIDVSKDFNRIESIIKKCESLYYQAKSNYESFLIKESMATLKKLISTLLSVKQTINTKKQILSPFIPQINMLEYMTTSTLNNYKINIYEAIDVKFKSITAQQYKNNEPLIDFCSKFILHTPFISFGDIYNNNKMVDYYLDRINEANRSKKKCILLYGDRGSGKSLLVHAYAKKMGGSVAQINGDEFLKIPFFAKQFVKVCFKNIGFNKPLFVYIKNIENMYSCKNQFDFIYDKVASSFNLNIYFIASTNIDLRNLHKDIYNKFQFFQEVKTIETSKKADFIKFLCEKFDIKLNSSYNELNNFVYQNLDSFPNKKIFELIKNAINIKKQKTLQSDEPNWVYKEGLNLFDLQNALSSINPYL